MGLFPLTKRIKSGLSERLVLRKKLYSKKGLFGKAQNVIFLFMTGTNFDNKFYAFGWRYLLKDMYHVVTSCSSVD